MSLGFTVARTMALTPLQRGLLFLFFSENEAKPVQYRDITVVLLPQKSFHVFTLLVQHTPRTDTHNLNPLIIINKMKKALLPAESISIKSKRGAVVSFSVQVFGSFCLTKWTSKMTATERNLPIRHFSIIRKTAD